MRRALYVLSGLLACIFLILAAPRYGADEPKKPEEAPTLDVDPVGKSPKYRIGASRRYQIWYDDDGWHVHTTTAGEKHEFRGFIRCEGGYFTYGNSGGQAVEAKKRSKNKDHIYFDSDRKILNVHFITAGHEDLAVFKLSAGAKRLFFNLKVDDKEQPELIYIGKKGEHPPTSAFWLPAFPGKK